MTIETVGRPFGIQVFDVLPLGAKPTLIAKIIRFEESLSLTQREELQVQLWTAFTVI